MLNLLVVRFELPVGIKSVSSVYRKVCNCVIEMCICTIPPTAPLYSLRLYPQE